VFDTTAERFMIRDYDLPPLGPEDVQVRIELAAPKHGTESHIWSGNVNRGRRWDPELRMFLDPPPGDTPSRPALMRVGNMAVGVVEEVGAGVQEIRPGDRVYGYMPVRDVHQTSAPRLRPLAGGLTPEAAVAIDPAP